MLRPSHNHGTLWLHDDDEDDDDDYCVTYVGKTPLSYKLSLNSLLAHRTKIHFSVCIFFFGNIMIACMLFLSEN